MNNAFNYSRMSEQRLSSFLFDLLCMSNISFKILSYKRLMSMLLVYFWLSLILGYNVYEKELWDKISCNIVIERKWMNNDLDVRKELSNAIWYSKQV